MYGCSRVSVSTHREQIGPPERKLVFVFHDSKGLKSTRDMTPTRVTFLYNNPRRTQSSSLWCKYEAYCRISLFGNELEESTCN